LWAEVTRYQQHAITFLSEMGGFPYPWPHMTAVEGAGIIAGGMEYPMMTIMGDYNQRGEQALYSVTAHELAHMWIPMIVSADERRYSWLDEGNTVFSTSEAMIDFFPERYPHHEAQNEYTRVARSGNEGPMMLFSDQHASSQQFIIASYRKPAAVLLALRKVLGEDVFEEAWKAFINEWAFKQAYPWDFFKTFERISGEDLSWFWYSWYYTTWVMNQSIDEVEEVEYGTRIVIKDKGEVPMPVYLTVTYGDDHVDTFVIPVEEWLEGSRYAEIEIPVKGVRKVQIDSNRSFPDIDRQNMTWEW
ncbi:M1 family aminopeptidase, partial [Balneolaceae bacterium ANBcel3]|nr:M1 family aminopeptidase [Balneolaceae bacterium ANBcel3]